MALINNIGRKTDITTQISSHGIQRCYFEHKGFTKAQVVYLGYSDTPIFLCQSHALTLAKCILRDLVELKKK